LVAADDDFCECGLITELACYFTNNKMLISGIVCLTMLCYVIPLINLNLILTNSGKIPKPKFREGKVYNIRISYIGQH